MIYLFETKIDPKLTVEKGLTKIFGIGKFRSEEILNLIGIQKRTLFKDISKNEISRIKKIIEKEFFVGSRLRQNTKSSIQNLVKIRSYRGSRHKNKLPVRGQRTSSNARTQKKRRINS